MESPTAKGATVTFTPIHQGRYLFVQRHVNDDVLGGYWCFPGGKIEIGETIPAAINRECQEEIGLELTGRAFFVDSFLLGSRFGLHFAVEAAGDKVTLGDDLQNSAWVRSVAELAAFAPRVPGIDTHLHYITEHLNRFERTATSASEPNIANLAWSSFDQFDLVEHRFLNR